MRMHEYKRHVKLVCLSECWQFNDGFCCSGRIYFFAECVAILTPEERQKQDDLVSILVGDQSIKGSLADSCLWYGRYLQSKFYRHWHLLAPALVGIEDNSTKPAPGDLVIVYSFVIEVAKLLKTRRNLALVEIVDELDNQSMLKPQMDEERAIPNQMVFATLGWLSMHRTSITTCVKCLTNLSTRYALRSRPGPCGKQT
jgi:hypothetical protein